MKHTYCVLRRSLLTLLFVLPTMLSAQSWDEIKNNNNYLSAEGCGDSPEEANQQAVVNLLSQISLHVESDFEMIDEERSDAKGIDSHSYVKNRVKTYSQSALNNTERLDWERGSTYFVGRYILRSEVERIFKARLDKAQEKVRLALEAEEAGQVDDALRNYSQAIALTRSLQHPNEAYYETDDGQRHLMMAWLPQRMRAVLKYIKVQATGREGDDIELGISFGDKPVASMDFTYFDGRTWTPVVSAKDGKALIELTPGFTGKTLKLRIEHEYRNEGRFDSELDAVLKVVGRTTLTEASINVDANELNTINTTPVNTGTAHRGSTAFTTAASAPKAIADPQRYTATITKVLNAIRSRNYNEANACFTTTGLDMYQKLVTYGSAKLLSDPTPTFHHSGSDVVCRGVQMSFTFKQGVRKSFVEEVVFTLDNQARIKSLTFGLGNAAEQDILCKGAWPENVRVALMQFMENYKTAYALKRLDYLKTIFDENAVIIVGNEVQRTARPSMQLDMSSRRFTQKDVRYTRYKKDEYLRNLERSFNSKEFINIHFANNDVRKYGRTSEDPIYAIQIAQDYYSDNYADKGYLMLIIDMTDTEHPLIKVRTWQPDKDPNFGFYGPGDFN